ncbi:amino acid permease [Bacillus massiliglaciei]|uniref:amino acid permease n=1 Tax=Bacillus massiliglaciei TaxID=1816693 RepID=UPI000A639628|nr:amino acid permease [Bacillus massiliglaciei]
MSNKKLGLWILTALVVGNMVGSGIFMLPRQLGEVASPAGSITAWAVTGAGVLMLALVFGNLAIRKPHLSGGPQLYAKELFKKDSQFAILSGYMSTWGYWIGSLIGNIAVITTFAGYLSAFFPILLSQAEFFTIAGTSIKVGNALTFAVCTILLWGVHFIILRGADEAGKVNFIATAAKVLAFFAFIVIGLFAFEKSNIVPFSAAVVTDGHSIGILGQVNHAALLTLWAFIGVESAVVFASRARKQADVKRATILGLLISLAIYIGISTLVMGILSPAELVTSDKPLIDAFSSVVGPIGGKILAAVALVSFFGSTIGWVMLSAEVPYQAAKQGMFLPRFLKTNKNNMPLFSMVVTNLFGQVFIFSTISKSIASAYEFMIIVATLSYLIPYLISSVFQLKMVLTGDTYRNGKGRITDGVIAVLASAYSIWVIYAGTADWSTFLLGVALLLSGLLFYKWVRPAKSAL